MSELTNENYFSEENAKNYMSASQFKEFLKCPACALAQINGEYVKEKTEALLMGSYVDAYFSGELDNFIKETPELFKKDGTLKKDYIKCDEIIEFIKKDEQLMKYLSGEHQRVVKGVIAGVPFRGKIDSFFPDKCIVDQKIMKDLGPVWDEEEHCYKNVIDYWGYTIQGAIYTELIYQETGKRLPFVLAITTKEKVPSKALVVIEEEDLNKALDLVKEKAPIFQKMKNGEISAPKCKKCDYCKTTYQIKGIKNYHELDPYKED